MITIQAGNYSNFVGAHFFNLQNPETQHNESSTDAALSTPLSLWREVGRTSSQSPPSLSPRLLVIDTKANVTLNRGSKSTTAASKHQQNISLWDGKVDLLGEESDEDEQPSTTAKSVFGSPSPLPTDYSQWGDFATWKLSPNNIHLLPNFSHNPETGELDSYGQGMEVWKSLEVNVEEGIRRFAEECDRLEGFNIFVDQLNGYSGLAGGLLQHVSDEYEKKVCLGIGFCPPLTNINDDDAGAGRAFRTRTTNSTLLYNAFNSYSTVFTSLGLCQDFCAQRIVPVVLPYLNFKAESFYESSAILAVALDTLLSPCFSTIPSSTSSISLQELASFLSAMGRKMTTISSSFPFPLDCKKDSLFSILNSSGMDSARGLTPGVNSDFESSNGNFFSARGIPETAVLSEDERKGLIGYQRQISNAQSCLDLFTKESFSKSVNIVRSSDIPVIVKHPFPSKVVEEFAKDTFKFGQQYSNGVVSSWSFSAVTSAQNSTKCGDLLDKVVPSGGHKHNRNRITQTLPSANELGMEVDDFMESVNNLQTLRSTYNANFDD